MGVNLPGGRTSITFDPAKVDLPQMVRTVDDVGYQVAYHGRLLALALELPDLVG